MDQTVLLGLFTVLASGLVSAVVTYSLNVGKEYRVTLRDKAERLYLSADEHARAMFASGAAQVQMAAGLCTYEQLLDQTIKSASEIPAHGSPHEMRMLLLLYFPELKDNLEDFEKAKDRLNSVKLEHDLSARTGEAASREWSNLIVEEMKLIGRAGDEFRESIIAAARVHTERGLGPRIRQTLTRSGRIG